MGCFVPVINIEMAMKWFDSMCVNVLLWWPMWWVMEILMSLRAYAGTAFYCWSFTDCVFKTILKGIKALFHVTTPQSCIFRI